MDRSTGSSNSRPLLDQNRSQTASCAFTTASGAAARASPASLIAAAFGSAASRLVTMATACRWPRVTRATAKLIPAQPGSPGICCRMVCTSGSRLLLLRLGQVARVGGFQLSSTTLIDQDHVAIGQRANRGLGDAAVVALDGGHGPADVQSSGRRRFRLDLQIHVHLALRALWRGAEQQMGADPRARVGVGVITVWTLPLHACVENDGTVLDFRRPAVEGPLLDPLERGQRRIAFGI